MVVQFFPKSPVPKDQRHELAIVYTHCAVKAFQVSAVLAPLTKLALMVFKKKIHFRPILIGYNLATLPGIGFMAYKQLSESDKPKNQSRAFRLQRNVNQYYLEDWTLLGLALGVAFGTAFPPAAFVYTTLLGSSLGFYTGQGILTATNQGFIKPDLMRMTTLSGPKA